MTSTEPFESVWSRIEACAGETFHQVRGQPFTYAVDGSALKPSTTNRSLPRAHFVDAVGRPSVRRPSELNDLQGPSYIYAVINDDRIRPDGLDWSLR